ncbi:SusC/RagA family TonB-linked outer membrane protein [Sunxiuqinia elliptica]|uniref:TonB-linked SusC/RagA family outer membrane protein n=1 Tax=Sunxiuqinia elliptica TaxID=655355 RepID=A0A4R6H1W5_9BACT|nr:TonB-dependent receptor [Sunxiuqinia elliptica]TDO01361.1 TonB-linked SusC/RagA family outer membrane protein [Sunxiuqinia elliptica]TDO57872.1 TonB-linked SusC/RagA family outer membrane protein [Sunxiuqinia elliptica]
MKKGLLLIFLLCLTIQMAMAQKRSITGSVIDKSTSEPLPGVTVVEKGTNNGTVTNLDGKFNISVKEGATLQISFIGMQPQEVPVGQSSTINVQLEPSTEEVSEVVVVGYGIQKKTNLTGAVASVDTKVLEARPIADVGRGLQGSTAGLNVVIPSGEVGSDPILKIRGQLGSFEGGASPLILLDNVEIPSIQLVNPDDIESISILKDAASASIYGAKGAFGVILITSKKGAKTESVNVSYSGNLSFQNISKRIDMGGVDALEYSILAAERNGNTSTGAFWKVTRDSYEKAKAWEEKWGGVVGPNDPMLYGRDWYVDANNRKLGLRTYDPYDYMIEEWTPTQQHNLSVSGRSGKTDYNIGFGYLDQTGMMKAAKEDNFKRHNGSVRIGTEVNKYLKVHAGTIFSKRVKRYPYATSSTTADPWLYLYRWAPIYPLSTEDGDPIRSPVSEVSQANTAFRETNYTSLNGGFVITPVEDWKINFDYTHANEEYINKNPGTRYTARNSWGAAIEKLDEAGNRIHVNEDGVVVPASANGAIPAYQLNMYTYTGVGNNPDHVYRIARNKQWNTINLNTTYDLTINEIHDFNFMLGLNRVTYQFAENESRKTELVDYNNPQFELSTGTQTSGGDENWESQLGFFGRVNYNFNEKYLLEANLRYDGTSKFPSDLQWRWFPSFSAGWRVSEENWMESLQPVLSSLKLRGSWGSIGDQTVPNSLYIPTMKGEYNRWIIDDARLYQFGTPASVTANISWQDITTTDFGFDARFIDNKLGLSFDWFRRDTENMLVPQEGLPTTYGTIAPKGNFGSLRTDGVELQLDFNHRFRNGLGISVVATLADAKTKITKYGSTNRIDSWYVGKTYGEIWGYETDRLYQKEDFVYDSEGKLVTEVTEDGYTINKLSDPNEATQGFIQSGDFKFGPGDVKFKDLNGDGEINDGNKLTNDHGDLKKIGNFTPRYEYSFRVNADYKGFDLSVFMQGVGKRDLWGSGFLAIPGFNAADGAMPQAMAGDFWREDRTDAFYPRPSNLANSNNKHNMVKQSKYLLDMSYLRIKNITVGYTLPENLTQKVYMKKLRVYIALENFFTFDNLRDLPIDPEVISGYSMWNDDNYNLGRTGMGTPTFKSASVGVQLNF